MDGHWHLWRGAGHHAGGKNTAWWLGAMLTFIT